MQPDVHDRCVGSVGIASGHRIGRTIGVTFALTHGQQARLGASPAAELHAALVNGTPGMFVTMRGRPYVVMAFSVTDGFIVEIDIVADAERVRRAAASVLSSN